MTLSQLHKRKKPHRNMVHFKSSVLTAHWSYTWKWINIKSNIVGNPVEYPKYGEIRRQKIEKSCRRSFCWLQEVKKTRLFYFSLCAGADLLRWHIRPVHVPLWKPQNVGRHGQAGAGTASLWIFTLCFLLIEEAFDQWEETAELCSGILVRKTVDITFIIGTSLLFPLL
jgi:hypothetical protein